MLLNFTFLIELYEYITLKNLRIQHFDIEKLWSNKFKGFLHVWTVYFVAYMFFKVYEAVTTLSNGLANAYDERHNEGNVLFEYDNIVISKLNSYGGFISNATVPVVMLFSLIGVARGKISKTYSFFLIALCFVPPLLQAMGAGSRGSMFMTMFCFLFFIILFYNDLPKKFVRRIISGVLLLLFFSIFFSWLITADRVGEGSDGFNSILRYFGESFPNLGFSFWDKVILHPMGLRLFPDLFGFTRELGSTSDEYEYWQIITGVPVLNFKTFFGDLYIEFGTVIALLITFFLSLSFRLYYRKNGITIYNIPFLYFYFQLCVFSLAGFTKGGHLATFQIIIIILFVLFLKFIFQDGKKSTLYYRNL